MSGYHNIVLPDEFSAGSSFSIGYDTRITVLESGIETRMARYRPDGRRRYSVLRGIANKDTIQAFYEFYVLRNGALNSFKFQDWFDYVTNATRTLFQPDDPAITVFDSDMTFISGRTYQMTTTYQDAANSIVRPLTKIKQGTELVAANGLETVDYTINIETGQVTFGAALGVITQASAGCEFYTVVRFAENTDEAFTVAMQATDSTQSLPGFELIEDISASTISQDYQYGGSWSYIAPTADIPVAEINGRLQTILQLATVGLKLILPGTLDIPTGGPIFIFHNDSSSSQSIEIVTSTLVSVTTLLVGETAMLMLGENPGGKFWLSIQS